VWEPVREEPQLELQALEPEDEAEVTLRVGIISVSFADSAVDTALVEAERIMAMVEEPVDVVEELIELLEAMDMLAEPLICA